MTALTITAWPTASGLTYGQTLAASILSGGAATVPGVFAWTNSSTTPGAGTAAQGVTFTPKDTTDYTVQMGTANVAVQKATPTVSVWPTASAISYGQTLATSILSGGVASVPGTFTWAMPASVQGAGSAVQSVIFNPSDSADYNTATGSVALMVNKAVPAIAWPIPAAIPYGTALGNAQLDANAGEVAGTFTYSPAAGVILPPGTQKLTVSFVPADTTNYTTAVASVSLLVNQGVPQVTQTSDLATVLLHNPVTFTATVNANAAPPSGAVSFLEGSILLGTSTLTGSTASFSTSSLALGLHHIVAAYSGDSNFVAASSAELIETVITINIGAVTIGVGGTGTGSGATQTVLPGGAAVFALPITPSNGTIFPTTLTLTISGMPPGATASVIPSPWVHTSSATWTLAANTPLSGDTLVTVQLQPTSATAQLKSSKPAGRVVPWILALLLLTSAGRLRRAGKRLGRLLPVLLLLTAGIAALAGVSGCGSTTGFFAQPRQTYPITVTISSDGFSQSVPLSLTVE
jgi:hypothetical protein